MEVCSVKYQLLFYVTNHSLSIHRPGKYQPSTQIATLSLVGHVNRISGEIQLDMPKTHFREKKPSLLWNKKKFYSE